MTKHRVHDFQQIPGYQNDNQIELPPSSQSVRPKRTSRDNRRPIRDHPD